MPDRAENNFAIMRCCARVVPLRIVNKKLLRQCERKARLLVLTPIAKPMNRFAACGDPRAERGPRIEKMTNDEMIEWFEAAPMGSRHQRMIWAAHKIAHLTGVIEGRAYQMLLGALIEAEREPRDEPGRARSHAMTNAQIAAPLRLSKK